MDLPLRGGDAAVLVGVGVADHHLLGPAPQLDEAPVGLHRQQLPQHRPDRAQVVDRLEQRHEPEPGHTRSQVHEPRLTGEHGRRQHVFDTPGHGHDVALHDLVAPGVHLVAQHPEQLQDVLGVGSQRAPEQGQRPGAGQLLGEQDGARGARQRGVIDSQRLEQAGQRPVVAFGVLSDVQRGEIKSDHCHDAPHAGQPAAGQQATPVGVQRPGDHRQIVGQLVGRVVRPRPRCRFRRLEQAPVDHRQPLPVGLARAERVETGRHVRELPVIDLEPLGQLRGNTPNRQPNAQLRRQTLDLLHQDAKGPLTLELEHRHRGGRRDVGIAVAVASHPRAETDGRAIGIEPTAQRGQHGVDVVEELGHALHRDLREEIEDRPGLVHRVGSLPAQLVGLPDGVDQLVHPAVGSLPGSVVGTGMSPLLDEA